MTSIVEVYQRWPTKEACIDHLEAVRWGGHPLCPYCGADRVSRNRDSSRGLTAARWKCQRCLKSFSVTVGTIFHNSHIDLQRWFLLISLMLSSKKGLSAMQAARDLDMRRPTVWSMMHRVRKSLADDGASRGLSHYAAMLQTKGYVYGEHHAPADIRVRELGSGKSRIETARALGINNLSHSLRHAAANATAVRGVGHCAAAPSRARGIQGCHP